MKVKVSLKELSQAWTIVATAVPQRSPRPVLSNIKIVCGDKMELSATDLEIGIRYTLEEAEILEKGECLVNADRIGRVLRETGSESIEIESKDGLTRLVCESDSFELPGGEVGHFPESRPVPSEGQVSIDAVLFETLVRQTVFAAAREESRYALNGVLLHIENGNISAVATDGKRLARVKGKCKSDKKATLKALVPLKAVTALERILSQGEVPVGLSVDDGNLYASAGRAEVTCRLLEGSFPEFEEVIPKSCPWKATIKRQEFSSKLRMADAFTSEDSRAVRMKFSKKEIIIRADVADSGRASVVVPVEYDGEELEIAFNPQYFLDALKVLPDDKVVLELKDSQSSAKLTVGDRFVYVVMPLAMD